MNNTTHPGAAVDGDLGLAGRRALVTGGSRGIGAATADLLATRGARVLVVARSEPEGGTRSDIAFAPADLASPDGAEKAADALHRTLGKSTSLCTAPARRSPSRAARWR